MTPRPILSALRRHKIAAFLIVLEIALAFAIVSNAVYLVMGRLQRMDIHSGIDERDLVALQISSSGNAGVPSAEADLATLRTIPGVQSASAVNSLPFTNSSWNSDFTKTPGQDATGYPVTIYLGSRDLLPTLGVKILAGRGFSSDQYTDLTPATMLSAFFKPTQVIVSKAYAEHLWPGENAVGKLLYVDKSQGQIVGVMSNIVRPQLSDSGTDPSNFYAAVLPFRVGPDLGASYVLCTAPAARARVLKAAVAKLQAMHPTQTVTKQATLSQMRREYFANDRAMAWLLLSTVIALLGVTAIGIVGLASFWVQQRTRQIGVRRALGARRVDILRYFQTE
ncbi:ABC transporter permease, partial [Metallibacterium sp.]|uniref:ABC transporter permease n=1 Tax=Metallibacterium sp. TaxID=2940281 RepID=UPI00263987A6